MESKQFTIFNNYDIDENYESTVKALWEDENQPELSEAELWYEYERMSADEWELTKDDLIQFFDNGSQYILFGSTGRWDKAHQVGYIFSEFLDMFYKATKDCYYWHIFEKRGHLYLTCSHHDGTNYYEIKKLTERGEQYLRNWENNDLYERSERTVHEQIIKRYSVTPNYIKKCLAVNQKK